MSYILIWLALGLLAYVLASWMWPETLKQPAITNVWHCMLVVGMGPISCVLLAVALFDDDGPITERDINNQDD